MNSLSNSLLLFALVLFGLSKNADAQCTPGPGPLGCVDSNDIVMCVPSSQLVNDVTTCTRLSIYCPGASPIQVFVEVSDPEFAPILGTIMFGSSGSGESYYDDLPGARIVTQDLLDRGYRIVRYRWTGFGGNFFGWTENGTGLIPMSNRYATLLEWVNENVYKQGGGSTFALTGNSAGASLIAYAFSKWDMSDLVDVAVLSSGPVNTRMDFVCPNSSAAPGPCPGHMPQNIMLDCVAGQIACTGCPDDNICRGGQSCATPVSPSTLHDDSVLFPNAIVSYPTRVHVLLGTRDCNIIGPAMGQLYFDNIQSEKVVQYVKNGIHSLTETPAGRDAIIKALLAGMDQIPTPASISPRSWPKEGGNFSIDFHGPPNAYVRAAFSTSATTSVLFPALGWSFLDQPFLGFRALRLDSVTGKLNYTWNIPAGSGLAGTEFFWQAQMVSTTKFLVKPLFNPYNAPHLSNVNNVFVQSM
ncbi:MAG: hypothetical protein ACI8TQ_001905 [Planctomycetota bacterium]|jgi:hypothetical protein